MSPVIQLDISQIRAELRQMVCGLIGAEPEEIDDEAPLLDYVTSSLTLLAGIRMVYDRYGVLVPIRPLLEGAGNLRALSVFIDQALQAHDKNLIGVLPWGQEAEQGPRTALAPSQQHIGFLARYSSGASAAYGESIAVRLCGRLHGPALQAALQAVAERYEAARAALDRDSDAVVLSTQQFEIPISHCSDADIGKRIGDTVSRPFEPGERLFRAELLRVSETDHVLVLAAHALVVDHEALVTILEDVAESYSAFARGDEKQTTPSAVQLTEYMKRHEQEAVKRAQAVAENYWKNVFAQEIPLLEIPCDKPRPAVKNYEGMRLVVPLPDDLLSGLGQWPDLPPAVVLFGAFTAFLHRLAAQNDIVVGARSGPIHLNGESRVVGPTREMLPVRSGYDPSRRFADHVRLTSARFAEANDHRQLSLAEIIRVLNVPRDQGRSALFSAAFRTNTCDALPVFEELNCTFMTVPVGKARYDIEVILASSPGTTQLWWDYSTELFEAETISRWVGGFLKFLQAGLDEQDRHCGSLPMMTDRDRQTLLHDWNANDRAYPRDRTALDLFVDQVRAAGDRVAIQYKDEQLTYAELGTRTECIAAMLVGSDVRPGDRVAVLLRRSPALIAAIIGVWRAGAAYVPIDPDLPKKRIGFMLADAAVGAIITSHNLADIVDPTLGVPSLYVDAASSYTTDTLPAIPASNGDDSAYVIYTSGSTGQPKGVEIFHRSLLNCLLATRELIGFTESDSLLAITTPSFDISTVELFMPLVAGGVLQLGEDDLQANGIRLAERIDNCKPSYVQATPSTWKMILAAGWQGDQHLRMGVTGEAVSRDLAEQLLSKGQALWNLYGPTETTVYATAYRVRSAPDQPMRIGRPLSNTRLYLLDEQRQPIPLGAVGELYIGGEGLARGYVGKPEQTKERFVPSPFRPGELLYRTGDLARYLPDGDVICLGRIDYQVKVHGYRVELGEVEAALRAAAGVRDAVVTTWIDSKGDQQLVAHIVADATVTSHAAVVRQRLRESLPESMVPPYFIFCDNLPLTPSGKIDRAALPAPGLEKVAAASADPPVTSTERQVSEAWATVLGIAVDRIGRDDDFMDLGGHSLLMTQLMVEVRKQFHVTFSLRDLFAASTLRKFSALVDELQGSSTGGANGRDQKRARDAEWGRQRMAFLQREAELPLHIAPARGLTFRPAVEVRNVLLTGATGFLGAYILNEILQTSSAHVHCLVRSKQTASSHARIEVQLRQYRLWSEVEKWQSAWEQRVHVVAGDVILPRLGLTDPAYETLAREIDCIIHSAAHVNFIYPYEALKATNVLGLHEIIRFAFHGSIKPVHYLSTAAIWPMGTEYTFFESDSLDHGRLLNLGYDEAKWVGEKCLTNAVDRGLPVARYRPGEVGGDSKTGRCVLNHFLFAALKGFLQFGAVPSIDTHVDVAPVDYVARAIVHMALGGNTLGRAFHLTNPQSLHMKDGLAFLRKEGYQFEEVHFEELRRRLIMSPDFTENALFPYQAALEGMEERSLQLPKYDCRQALRELEGSGIVCPPADETLFSTYLRYLKDVDFLPGANELRRSTGNAGISAASEQQKFARSSHLSH
jgi:myxalamid-type nonribosomal peptide synthetase MxaA